MTFFPTFRSAVLSQKGAMFGLDARIAMAIFAIMSVAAGAALTLKVSDISSGALTDELNQYAKAVEGMHNDIQQDIHTALIATGTADADVDAVISLYNSDVLTNSARWIGPYTKNFQTKHIRFGEMRLTKKLEDHGADCTPSAMCYLWWVIEDVPIEIAAKVNQSFDGGDEASPFEQGRLQADEGEFSVTLFYRVSKALNRN